VNILWTPYDDDQHFSCKIFTKSKRFSTFILW